ncbi:hypothetical protein JW756_04645 [Candidatus Woesearchaeota archaeon]|nr:hypothetical protein [Candidatus Woesearchaeota archaeon]
MIIKFLIKFFRGWVSIINERKAQVAIEFMLMVSLAMVVMVMFMGVVLVLTHDYSEEKNINRLQDLGYALQSELILAAEVEPGYERTILIPEKAGDSEYSITCTAYDIVITYRGAEHLFAMPNITSGAFQKGNNKISKPNENSVIITNS